MDSLNGYRPSTPSTSSGQASSEQAVELQIENHVSEFQHFPKSPYFSFSAFQLFQHSLNRRDGGIRASLAIRRKIPRRGCAAVVSSFRNSFYRERARRDPQTHMPIVPGAAVDNPGGGRFEGGEQVRTRDMVLQPLLILPGGQIHNVGEEAEIIRQARLRRPKSGRPPLRRGRSGWEGREGRR